MSVKDDIRNQLEEAVTSLIKEGFGIVEPFQSITLRKDDFVKLLEKYWVPSDKPLYMMTPQEVERKIGRNRSGGSTPVTMWEEDTTRLKDKLRCYWGGYF